MKRALLAALLLAFSSLLSASDTTREGQEILDLARSKSDIRELSPFTMKARIKVGNGDKFIEGEYTLLWNGPDQWREESSFPGFKQIRIGGSDTVALKRSLDYVPLLVYQLQLALSYGRGGLTLRPDEEIKRVRTRKVNGIEARCAEITSKGNTREVCVDASTGALLRDNPFVDKGFAPFSEKIFPHILSYVEQGKTVAEAEIIELKANERLPSAAFEVPAGAVSKPSCLNPTVGHLIEKVSPSYPPLERRLDRQGTVALYAVLGPDGRLHDVRIVSGVTPGLNEASLNAVKQWRYEPYMCKDIPVEVETVIQVNFSLQH